MSRTIILAIAFLPLAAHAGPERSLPRGEEVPAVVERIYSSSTGELQLVSLGDNRSAFLRDRESGSLASFVGLTGPDECEQWFVGQDEALPRGCELRFFDEALGRRVSVRSEELEESSLFQSVRGSIRERGKYVAL